MVYIGQTYKSIPHGSGHILNNNFEYIGNFKYGVKFDQGKIIFKNPLNIISYDGHWINNMMYRYGKAIYVDGTIYKGNWKANKKHGYGKLIKDNDIIYEGFWSYDNITGYGILQSKNNIYSGFLINGNKHMFGTMQNNDEIYRGYWFNNLRDGFGTLYRPHNNIVWYEGDFYKGRMFGNGKATYSNGSIYTGDFYDDMCHGLGKLKTNNFLYIGTFLYNIIDENGKYIWNDGTTYSGEIKSKKLHGKGILHTQQGHSYDGQWDNNYAHGKGIFYHKNGDRFEGNWTFGVRNGYGTYIWANNNKMEAFWSFGRKYGRSIHTFTNKHILCLNWYEDIAVGLGSFHMNNGIECLCELRRYKTLNKNPYVIFRSNNYNNNSFESNHAFFHIDDNESIDSDIYEVEPYIQSKTNRKINIFEVKQLVESGINTKDVIKSKDEYCDDDEVNILYNIHIAIETIRAKNLYPCPSIFIMQPISNHWRSLFFNSVKLRFLCQEGNHICGDHDGYDISLSLRWFRFAMQSFAKILLFTSPITHTTFGNGISLGTYLQMKELTTKHMITEGNSRTFQQQGGYKYIDFMDMPWYRLVDVSKDKVTYREFCAWLQDIDHLKHYGALTLIYNTENSSYMWVCRDHLEDKRFVIVG
jgi:hypothetical protein